MLVSILVPVYNTAPYLDRCMDSLLNQTYSDLEVVVINDGSTDNSFEKLLAYQKKDTRVHVFSYSNSGISKTRNRALAKAKGDLILFVDSDDYIEPDMLEVMVNALKKRNLDLVQCNFVMDFGPVPFFRRATGNKTFTNLEALHALVAEKYLNNYPWGKLYKKELFEGITFPENMKGFEDTCTIFKTIANAKRVGTIPERFYHYEQRMGSLTNCMSLTTVYGMRRAYQYQEEYLKKRFPNEQFSFDQAQYNTDMVLIYTLIVFSRRKDDPKFVGAKIDWSKLNFSPVMKAAYEAWLKLAELKLGDSIVEMDENTRQILENPPANLDWNKLLDEAARKIKPDFEKITPEDIAQIRGLANAAESGLHFSDDQNSADQKPIGQMHSQTVSSDENQTSQSRQEDMDQGNLQPVLQPENE